MSPHTLIVISNARVSIFVYKISTARRAVCTCVYIQIFFVHNDFVHNDWTPGDYISLRLNIAYMMYAI